MDNLPRNPAGAPVAQCADDAACHALSCAVCLEEVPPDALHITDAQDYVHHFCGLECLEIWRQYAALCSGEAGSPPP
jgi:hypothetical protein